MSQATTTPDTDTAEMLPRMNGFDHPTAEALNPRGDLLAFLGHCGYLDARLVRSARYVAISPLMYTFAIIVGPIEHAAVGYEDRWCYQSLAQARAALSAWDGEPGTEPTGWIRHPLSGRRRPDGDPALEYIAH